MDEYDLDPLGDFLKHLKANRTAATLSVAVPANKD